MTLDYENLISDDRKVTHKQIVSYIQLSEHIFTPYNLPDGTRSVLSPSPIAMLGSYMSKDIYSLQKS